MAEELSYTGKVHPKKFSLWLLLLSIMMLFAGLTSAYIVRRGDGNWFNFQLPTIFLFSTLLILASSATMYFAFKAIKNDNLRAGKLALLGTIVLGILFVISQYIGWIALSSEGLYFVNPKEGDKVSASFFIAIAGVHLLHILAGLIFVVSVYIRTLKNKINDKNTLPIDMCNTYWHFIGLLWVYLYLFLYFAPDF